MNRKDDSLSTLNDPGSEYQSLIFRLDQGDFLEEYSIIEPIGSGLLGRLYMARHTSLGLSVAIRVLPEEFMKRDDALDRFTAAAAMMDVLDHPNLVKTNNFRQTNGVYWYRMDLANGEGSGVRSARDLAEKTGGVIDQMLFTGILEDVLKGVAVAHEKGIVHSSLTPSAILLYPKRGGGFQARVSNFCKMTLLSDGRPLSADSSPGNGSPQNRKSSLWTGSTGVLPGSWDYAAPEQINRQVCDIRTDVYQIGLIMYRLLTGQKLSPKLPSAINPRLDERWDRIILKALETRPEVRFRNAGEMLDALKTTSCPAPAPKLRALDKRRAIPSGDDACRGEGTAKKQKSRISSWIFSGLGIAAALLITFMIVDSRKQCIPEYESADMNFDEQTGTQINYHDPNRPPGIGKIEKIKQTPLQRLSFSTSTIDLSNRVPMEVIYMPAGSFEMGVRDNFDSQSGSAKPAHEVNIKGFWIGKYEVTQKQYSTVMRANPSEFQVFDHPVENLTWHDALNFCGVLSQMTGYTVTLPTEAQWEYACRAGSKAMFSWGDNEDIQTASQFAWFRQSLDAAIKIADTKLPNTPTPKPTREDRWKAERERKREQRTWWNEMRYKPRKHYPLGRNTPEPDDVESSTEDTLELIRGDEKDPFPPVESQQYVIPTPKNQSFSELQKWYDRNNAESNLKRPDSHSKEKHPKIHVPVGLKRPNLWNLYDMEGNVQEWCMDAWTANYRNAPSDGSAVENANSKLHVVRGGSYVDGIEQLKAYSRSNNGKQEKNSKIGFRIVIPDAEDARQD